MKNYFIISLLFKAMQIANSRDEMNKNTNDIISIVGFGQPNIDSVLNYNSDPKLAELIKKKLNYQMTDNFPVEFYQEVLKNKNALKLLGGSALNTIRITNHINQKLKKLNNNLGDSYFMGSTGDDENQEFLKKGLSEEGIIFKNQEFSNVRTSTCIVLIEKLERRFFSDLGGSEKVTISHFEKNSEIIKNCKIFYADAYLIGKRFDCFEYVFKKFADENVILSLGMASENIIRDFGKNIDEIFPYIDLLFLNSEEVKMWKINNKLLHLTNEEFIKHISTTHEKQNKNKKRVIVNTRGLDDTIIYVVDYINNTEEFFKVPIYDIDRKLVVDLNGAGDAFAGGFLAGIINGCNLRESANLGNRIASEVIQLTGFQIPSNFDIEGLCENLNEENKNNSDL